MFKTKKKFKILKPDGSLYWKGSNGKKAREIIFKKPGYRLVLPS